MNSKPSIILIGMKSSGKTTIGRILARKLGLRFTDVDAEVERLHFEQTGERLRFREIFKKHGKDHFRHLETAALRALSAAQNERPIVLATGGGTSLITDTSAAAPESRAGAHPSNTAAASWRPSGVSRAAPSATLTAPKAARPARVPSTCSLPVSSSSSSNRSS